MRPLAPRAAPPGLDARRLEDLYEIGKVLVAHIESVEATVTAILEIVAGAVPLRNVVLIEKSDSRARLFAWRLSKEGSAHLLAVERAALSSYAYITGGPPTVVEPREFILPGAPELGPSVKAIVIPLVLRDQPSFGILQIEGARTLNEADLAFVNTVANQISIALDRHSGRLREVALRKQAEQAEREVRSVNENLERLISERTSQLEQRIKDLNAFAYTFAHDLRTPLRHIHGFSEIVIERGAENTRTYARRIMAAGRRLDEMIEDLLIYSRLILDEFKSKAVALSPLLTHVRESLEAEFKKSNAHLDLEGPLPRVLGHEFLLTQVFWNLLSNALKFTAPGVAPHIRIRAESRAGWTRLWVEDNGIGIAPAHQEKIFGVFQRLHSGGGSPGSGIGLAIVRRAVERMGGRVGVESNLGQGSRFWVEMKRAEDGG